MASLKYFTGGLLDENPVLVQMIGLCPLLAVSTSVKNGLGMGMATLFVLAGSNVIVSAVRKIVPDSIRIPVFLIIISTFVTIADYSMAAYVPDLHKTLGVFIPLIVVNCIILARAEVFAYRRPVFASFLDGCGMGLGFTLAIVAIGFIREFFGDGRLFGKQVWDEPAIIMILPPGAFITIGVLMVLTRVLKNKKK